MEIAISIALIIVSIAVIGAVLLQAKGGGLGNSFGVSDSIYGTRRGVEGHLKRITLRIDLQVCCLRTSGAPLFDGTQLRKGIDGLGGTNAPRQSTGQKDRDSHVTYRLISRPQE